MKKTMTGLFCLLCILVLGLLLYKTLGTKVMTTSTKHLLVDLVSHRHETNLLLGSSSVAHLDVKRLLHCDRWLNRGIGGATLRDIVSYLTLTPLSIQPSAVVIYAGENDISSGLTIRQTVAEYRQLLDLVSERYPDSEIHILAIKPSPKRRNDWPRFIAVNTALRQLSRKLSRYHFHQPLWPEAAMSARLLFQADGIHLTPAGYALFLTGLKPACPN
jgi:lysophospholipase L1-like esterase